MDSAPSNANNGECLLFAAGFFSLVSGAATAAGVRPAQRLRLEPEPARRLRLRCPVE